MIGRFPYVKGSRMSPSIGVEEALSIAYNNGATVQFDENGGFSVFRYFLNGRDMRYGLKTPAIASKTWINT